MLEWFVSSAILLTVLIALILQFTVQEPSRLETRASAPPLDIAALRSLLGDLGRGSFRDTARTRAEAQVTGMERDVLDFILGPSDRSFLAPKPE